MAPFIATTVQWVILPLIMCAIFAFAWIIASSAKTGELKVSSWAGFWAGLLTFVIYVVGQLSHIREPNLHYAPLPGLQFLPLGWGLTTGLVFLWIVRHAVPTRLVALLRLMLAGSSTSTIFTYIIDSCGFRSCTGRSAPRWGFSCTSCSFPPPSRTSSRRSKNGTDFWSTPCGSRWPDSSRQQEQQPRGAPG